jgi:hypothetical protein
MRSAKSLKAANTRKSAPKPMKSRPVKTLPNPPPNKGGGNNGPRKIRIEITIDTIGNETVYNFAYDPGTVHVVSGRQLEFEVTGVQLEKAWVVFDVPVPVPTFYVQVAPEEYAQRATMTQRGAHHYQFIGLHTNGDLVADVYCPSVIVH